MVLALLGVGFALLVLRVLPDALHPWLEDFEAYYDAAQRLAVGNSPYLASQLDRPVPAVCPDCYLYPPFLAQVLAPLSSVPLDWVKAGWAVVLAVSAWAAVWIGSGIGGARRSWERAAWCVVAAAFFFPVLKSVWLGNVGTLVALGVAMTALGGAAAGIGSAGAALLKMVPGTLVPVALVADRRSRWVAVSILVAAVGLAFLGAPEAWLEFPAVLRNMIAGSGDVYWNLSPAVMAQRNGLPETLVTLIRAGSLLGGLLAIVGSVWAARQPAGLPLAVLFAVVAMLIMPGTLWSHYLVVLLPLMAMAWPAAGPATRLALLSLSAGISVLSIIFTFVAAVFFLAAAIVLLVGHVLWRRMRLGPRDASGGTRPTAGPGPSDRGH